MVIDQLIRIVVLGFATLLTSVCLLLVGHRLFNPLVAGTKSYWMVKKRLRQLRKSQVPKQRHWLLDKLDMLLQSSLKNANEQTIYKFLWIEMAIFFTSIVAIQIISSTLSTSIKPTGIWISGMLLTVLIAFMITLLPVAILIYRLRLIRIQAGYDLASITGILLNKYRRHNERIYDALVATAELTKNPYIRQRLLKIAKTGQLHLDDGSLKKEIELFIFTIDTTFGTQLALAVQKAFEKGINITKSLETIDHEIQKNVQMIQEEKSQNLEVIHLAWLHPIAFVITLGLGTLISTKERLFQFQFETYTGQLWFTLSVISITVSLLCALWFVRPKNDL